MAPLRMVGLGGGSEEEVGSGDAEEEIGGPGGEDGREAVDIAHGSEEAVYDPVGQGQADGYSDSGESAAFSGGEGEGNGEDGHDQGDQGVGQFAVELDGKPFGVEAGLFEVGDVVGELPVVHFLGLKVFFFEVAG